MSAVDFSLSQAIPISPPIDETNQLKGFSIGRISKIVYQVLAVFFTVSTAVAIAATIITGTFPAVVLVVSSVVLGILLIAKTSRLVHPYLPEKVQNIVNLIRGTVVDIFALLALCAMFPVKQSKFDPKEKDKVQIPILLVHGYLHNSSGWAYHRYHYKNAGFTNVFSVDLGHPFHSIEEYAVVVQKKIKEIQRQTGRSDVRLVGHSMGGVVSAHYALYLARRDGICVKDLITLGSPLKGTHMAHIGLGKCAKQMRIGTDYITALSRDLVERRLPHFHQGSKGDIIITPCASSLNGNNNRNSLMHNDLGHGSFLFSDSVIRANIQRFNQLNPAEAV